MHIKVEVATKLIVRNMKAIFTFSLLLIACTFFLAEQAEAQGCVAVRDMSCSGGAAAISGNAAGLLNKGEFMALLGYRHFKSFRHFRGKHEEPHRVAEGTEVINYFNSFDLGLSYSLTNRIAITAVLPITFNDRSSMYEHYGNSVEANPDRRRFDTNSSGIGDLRVSVSYWMLNPAKYSKGNFALGLGVKPPTGNYSVEGDFHRRDSLGNDFTTRRPVDQSIQLGDGGWGVTLEAQGFHSIVHNLSMFFTAFYMSNPREHNGILRNPSADKTNKHNYFSVADQYAARVGFNYAPLPNLGVSAGGRIEGIPSEDLIGGKKGFRRPGYALSLEPGVTLIHKQATFNLNVPVAIFRNRVQSVQDKELTASTGNYRIGDAAFADFVVNATVAYRFGGQHKMAPESGLFKDVPAPK